MAKTSAPGLALQRFIESALCDIADGYLGARAIVDPPREHGSGMAPRAERIAVSFDLVVGHGEGREAVRVLNGAEATAAERHALSRLRFDLPLTIPGAEPPEAGPSTALSAATGVTAATDPTSSREAAGAGSGPDPSAEARSALGEPDDPLRSKQQDPEDLALM